MIPPRKWKWLGTAGHFIGAYSCQFHLATVVGDWLVSTIGEYIPDFHRKQDGDLGRNWWAENYPGEDVGCNRKYETMAFPVSGALPCGCPEHDGNSVWMRGTNDHTEANRIHMAACAMAARGWFKREDD